MGWAFLEAACSLAATQGIEVHAVLDARDANSVSRALSASGRADLLTLHPVPLPPWAARRWGDARTRASYLAWLPGARRKVRSLCRMHSIDVVHQVTFATATLPSALPRAGRAKRVWGPLALPFQRVYPQGEQARRTDRIAMWAVRRAALMNTRRADLVVATNEMTASELRAADRACVVEPNIAVTLKVPTHESRDEKLLSIAGLLIDRKRPWIAVEAMASPHLAEYSLQVIGDGPLRHSLEKLSRDLGVAERVRFLGHLEHADTMAAIARSRLLLHPASREGAAWVIGEAAAVGVPAVAFADVGSASTVSLSNNGGELARSQIDLADSLARAAARALERDMPAPTSRWDSRRFPNLLRLWWSL